MATLRCLVTRQPIDPLTDRYHTLRDTETQELYYVLDEALRPAPAATPRELTPLRTVTVCCGDGAERCIVRSVTGVTQTKRCILVGSRYS